MSKTPTTNSTAETNSSKSQETASGPGKKLAEARAFAIAAAQLAANTRCSDVAVLDLSGISPICDFFVIATGTSARQMRSVGLEIAELAEESKHRPHGSTDHASDSWVLIDCIDVLIHIFSVDARGYYDLQNLWGDAKLVDWSAALPASPG